jgi:hypothetical protein
MDIKKFLPLPWMRRKKRDETLIVVFANYAYFNVLENWLEAISRIAVDNYRVIALDQALYDVLQARKAPVLFRPCSADLKQLWVHRIEVILDLLEEGYDVIHSDADAVWLKNPQKYLDDLSCDMLFSQGTFWPLDVHRKWKFVLCCGFFMIRSSTHTIRFFRRIRKRVLAEKDDQISCNRQLLEEGIVWDVPQNVYILTFGGREFVCSSSVIEGKGRTLSAAVLPHRLFQRIAEPCPEAYVKHLISEKTSDDVMEVLAAHGCKFIE